MPMQYHPLFLGIALAVGVVVAIGSIFVNNHNNNRERKYREDSARDRFWEDEKVWNRPNDDWNKREDEGKPKKRQIGGKAVCHKCNESLVKCNIMTCQECDLIFHEACGRIRYNMFRCSSCDESI